MRYALTIASTLALAALHLASAPDARANGRFPESNALFFAPNDPGYVLMRTTFGELVSHDRGVTWDWVCERSVGLAGVEDPMYAITPDNTLIASSFQGLAVSRDRACNFAFVGGELKDLVMIDVASRPATPGTVVAFASSYDGQDDAGLIFFKSNLFETKDEGRTFATLGPAFDPTLLGETVDVTPSDPDRIYISAVRNPGTESAAFLLTSRDHGKTYVETSIPLVKPERAAFIAAVDPINADRLYVRTANATDMPSRLLVSDDAGKTFRTVFTGKGPLAGFAISDDGKKVWVGGPLDGLYVASTTDHAFQQKSKIEVQCLKVASDGLWACSNEKSGFVAGVSTDDGATFQTKLHFCDVRGPLACPVGSTTNNQCASANAPLTWPVQRNILGCSSGTEDGGVGDAGVDGAVPLPGMEGGGGGCAVRAPGATPVAGLIAGVVAGVGLLRRRRRR